MYLIDTNIFLEILLKQERNEQCKLLLSKVLTGEVRAVMTDFSIDGIVIKLESENKTIDDIKTFLKSLFVYKGLKIHSTSLQEKLLAATIMEQYGLDFDDAIQVQAALSNNIGVIISFDSDFNSVGLIKRVDTKAI